MKKLAVTLTILMFLAISSFSQDSPKPIKLTSASLSSGQDALSSGEFFEAFFERDKDIIGMYLGERDLAVYYLKSYAKDKVHVGPCLEYYFNVPTMGLMALESPIKNVSAMTWAGVSAGEPDHKVELLNWRFLFFWQSVDYNYKRFTASGAIMYFEGWHQIAKLQYKQPMNKHFSLFTSAGYDFYGEGKALLKIGICYVP